jgi:Fumarylacetoacetate (FAA) hydrolase family/Rv2993c-like, N-terminal
MRCCGGEAMKWCRFSVAGAISYGLIEGERVRKVDGVPWERHTVTAQSHALGDVKLALPVIPSTFFCVGVNYRDHVDRMAAKRGTKPSYPPRPDIGYRANNALIAHEENIVKPRDAGEAFQYEGELVAVFGRRCRNVSKADALSHVFGWTIGNDVSERGWQASDRTLWRAKNCDTFKPMGAVDRNRCGSRHDGDDDPPQRAGDRDVPDQQHDLRRTDLYRGGEPLLHHHAGRRDVDGHRRRAVGHEAGRRVRDRNLGDRRAEEQGRGGVIVCPARDEAP